MLLTFLLLVLTLAQSVLGTDGSYGNVVQILDQQGNWAYVQVINGPNARINGMRGWVNSYYLALL